MDEIKRVEHPKSGIVHDVGKGLFTKCGILFADLFATYEAGQMLMLVVDKPTTCKRCLK